MHHYMLFVAGDVSPELIGPFDSGEIRDNEARRLKHSCGDKHGIFWLNVDDHGVPVVGAYSAGFLSSDERGCGVDGWYP